MKIYTIIGGANGCGKSSLLGILKSERNDLGIVIDANKLSAEFGSNILGAKKAINIIDDCLNRGVSFTQESTLSGVKTEKTIIRAKEKGYLVRLYYIGLNSSNESILRVKNRVSKGGHNIPDDKVLSRFSSRFDDLMKILPYCDEATFFDNENGFIDIADYKNGELHIKKDIQNMWINEFYNKYTKECFIYGKE